MDQETIRKNRIYYIENDIIKFNNFDNKEETSDFLTYLIFNFKNLENIDFTILSNICTDFYNKRNKLATFKTNNPYKIINIKNGFNIYDNTNHQTYTLTEGKIF